MVLKKRKNKQRFNVGDKVRLRKDVLVRHSRSVPAHAGFTREQFHWRAVLNKYGRKVGKITRTFPSGHVNVTYRDGNTIGIDSTELVKA